MQLDRRNAVDKRDLGALAARPLAFMWYYIRRRPLTHAVVLLSVVAAVAFATFSQYAIKHLVDVLAARNDPAVWTACGILAALVTADNLSWRVGGWIATHGFVAVTGDTWAISLWQHRVASTGDVVLVTTLGFTILHGTRDLAVAHRLSTLRDFDRIVVMQRGRIMQDGAPVELEETAGIYRDLLSRQALHVTEPAA
jgi:hypothetical protein